MQDKPAQEDSEFRSPLIAAWTFYKVFDFLQRLALGAGRHGTRADDGIRVVGCRRESADGPLLLQVLGLRDPVWGALQPLQRQVRRSRRIGPLARPAR